MPEEVLTDNGKVFTGRFHKPGVAVEVLLDKICRENGITHRLTKIHSPTTTGKIERLQQTLQRELLNWPGWPPTAPARQDLHRCPLALGRGSRWTAPSTPPA